MLDTPVEEAELGCEKELCGGRLVVFVVVAVRR
jgi:hypothetical protein